MRYFHIIFVVITAHILSLTNSLNLHDSQGISFSIRSFDTVHYSVAPPLDDRFTAVIFWTAWQ